jgi:hypothetical protein
MVSTLLLIYIIHENNPLPRYINTYSCTISTLTTLSETLTIRAFVFPKVNPIFGIHILKITTPTQPPGTQLDRLLSPNVGPKTYLILDLFKSKTSELV